MKLDYPIRWEGNTVGYAALSRQGMFSIIQCHVSGRIPMPCRLLLCSHDEEIDLGIFVPHSDGFGLTARIPLRCVESSQLHFQIITITAKRETVFYPVEAHMPFSHIAHLRNALFAEENGKKGIKIPMATVGSQVPPDNDRNP